jgi:hypothetical protein
LTDTSAKWQICLRRYERGCQLAHQDEPAKEQLGKEYPYQVMIAADAFAVNLGDLFCKNLGVPVRTHWINEDGAPYVVYCFADPQHARTFIEAFGGDGFDPATGARMPLAVRLEKWNSPSRG